MIAFAVLQQRRVGRTPDNRTRFCIRRGNRVGISLLLLLVEWLLKGGV